MGYGDFKDLNRKTASYKIFLDKAFNIAKHLKYDWYQRGLASVVYSFFDKTSGGAIKKEIMSNQELAGELYKLIIRKLKKKKTTLISYRQYLGCWSCWYVINKQIWRNSFVIIHY